MFDSPFIRVAICACNFCQVISLIFFIGNKGLKASTCLCMNSKMWITSNDRLIIIKSKNNSKNSLDIHNHDLKSFTTYQKYAIKILIFLR